MNINNENYEEYFLLYADNELSAEQRKIVEMFVKSNPPLQKEWDELMATIQAPDPVSLIDKSFLFKRPVDGFIDEFNYEKRFVEYHDGELSDEEKSFVQSFLSEHPSIKNEFNLVSQAYLTAEEQIVFPDKELLYHKGRVVRYGIFLRLAAAAVFIGLIFWIGIKVIQKPGEPTNKNIVRIEPAQNIPQVNTPKVQPLQQEPHSTIDQPQKVRENNFVAEKNRVVKKTEKTEKKISPETAIKGIKTTAQPPTEIAVMILVPEKAPASEMNTTVSITEPAPLISHADIDATPVKPLPGTNYATFQQGASENNYVFTDIPAENIQRSKLGIFIKKVKRTIDRNNPIKRLLNEEEN